jgi:hypothetical protein
MKSAPGKNRLRAFARREKRRGCIMPGVIAVVAQRTPPICLFQTEVSGARKTQPLSDEPANRQAHTGARFLSGACCTHGAVGWPKSIGATLGSFSLPAAKAAGNMRQEPL